MVSLNKPAAGDTDWTTEINDNWSTLEGVVDQAICQGRLTLTSGTPVTTSDVTAATTLYFAPFRGNRIGIYSGSTWSIFAFTEKSLSLSGLTVNTNYDVFIYDSSGTPTLEMLAWTNDTTRATAITTQDGVYVKSGAATRRYLGTIRITGTTGQTEDSAKRRNVWNYYNRAPRRLLAQEGNDSWSYGTSTWRSARGSSTVGESRVEFVLGFSEDLVQATARGCAEFNPGEVGSTAIGLDTTSAPSDQLRAISGSGGTGADYDQMTANYVGNPAIGFHYFQWLENAVNGTITFYGDAGGNNTQTGIVGFLLG